MNEQQPIEDFIVTARKWRPLRFADVVGQEHISTTLSNAIRSNRIHHAYLFCGPRGVGKTTSARIFARAINCSNPNGIEPCNECDSCKDIVSGRSMDVIEIDGASNNSVDDIRKLRENAKYPPVNGKYKMYIIDEVHMLSTSAFNALLKTLEEPPPHLMFVFATTESHKIPATIISRCQRFDFRRMEVESIVQHLGYISQQENISIDEESLVAIAKKGDGSMRDSQSIFDQVRAFCGDSIVYADVSKALHLIDEEFFFTISKAVYERDVAAMFGIVRNVMMQGYDVQECLIGLLEHFRNILTILATGNTKLIETSSAIIERYKQEATRFTKADVLRIMTLISSTEQQLKFAPQPRLRFELLLSQLASMDSTIELGTLLQEIREGKKNGSLNGALPKVALKSAQTVAPKVEQPATTTVQEKTIQYNNAAPEQETPQAPQPSAPTPTVTEPPVATTVPVPPKASTEQVAVAAKASTNGTSGITAQHIQSGWESCLQNLPASAKMAIGSDDFCSVRFFDGEIVILNTEKFMCDNLLAQRAAIAKQMELFYGTSIKISVVHSEDIQNLPEQYVPIAAPAVTQEIASVPVIPAPNGNGVHNVDEKTIRRIGAEDDTQTVIRPASVVTPANTIRNGTADRTPLENTIVELFGAKKIPLSTK